MEAYLEDNRHTIDEVCESYDECSQECPSYRFCHPQAESEDTATKEKQMSNLAKGGEQLKMVEIKKMTFEEVKEMFKKSIDATDNMNQAIETLIQSIYLKGYNDALEHADDVYPNAKYKVVKIESEDEK